MLFLFLIIDEKMFVFISAGCPCPGYDCDSVPPTTSSAISTTSAPVQQFDTILILNQNREENVPLLYTIGGELKTVNFNLKIVYYYLFIFVLFRRSKFED